MMKKIMMMFVLLLTMSLVLLGCGRDGSVCHKIDHYVEEPFSFTVDFEDHTRLRLAGITGDVEVTGQPDAEAIIISGHRRVGSSSTVDARARLGDLRVDVQDLGSEVIVRTIQPADTEGASYIVNYTITLPPDVEILVGNKIGTVAVDGVHNTVTVNASTGTVILCQINGSACVDAANSTTYLQDIHGNVWADVLNGGVSLHRIEGDIHAEVKNGSIGCQTILLPKGVIDLRSVNGGVSLKIPETTSAQLTASVTNGNIDISNLPLHNQSCTNNCVTGQLRDGNGTICLQVVNGGISVSGCLDWM
jgi:DUF4097 and DUF4098 domain-containing protein YvlB